MEPMTDPGQTEDLEVHVRDYKRFVHLLAYGALTALVIAYFVLLIL